MSNNLRVLLESAAYHVLWISFAFAATFVFIEVDCGRGRMLQMRLFDRHGLHGSARLGYNYLTWVLQRLDLLDWF